MASSSNFSFGNLATRVARSLLESAVNATTSANATGTSSSGLTRTTSLDRIIRVSSPPVIDENAVVHEITGKAASDEVAPYPIKFRDSIMILYGPIEISGPKTLKYNIIMYHPHTTEKMFSLFRTNDEEKALGMFIIYKEAIPALVNIDPLLCDKNTLEKVCQKLREKKSWNAMHTAAYFDYYKCIRDPSLHKFINSQESTESKTPLHIAIAQKNLASVVELINLGSSLDLKDLKGNSVIHIAASESTPQILKLILEKLPESLTPLINDENIEGHTPMHLACKNSNPDVIKNLHSRGADLSIPSRTEGYPIHIAVVAKSTSVIQELCKLDPDQISKKNPLDGSSALHWADNVELVNELLKLGCDPNIVNDEGVAPLHFAAKKGCLKTALTLLCHAAFPDMADGNGETPLHWAAKLCSKQIIQVLVIFGADVNLSNNFGESARHLISTSSRPDKDWILFYVHAVGARRCVSGAHCTDGCSSGGEFNGIPPENFVDSANQTLIHQTLQAWSLRKEVTERTGRESGNLNQMEMEDEDDAMNGLNANMPNSRVGPPRKLKRQLSNGSQLGGRLLCLDGGGIRGLVLTQILSVMEQEFGMPPIEMFDFVAGTSTGGILALGLACGKSVFNLMCLYLRLKDEVFSGARPYKSEAMDAFLKSEFGEETTMNSIRRPRVMVTSALANRRPAELYLFRNYYSPAAVLEGPSKDYQRPEDVRIWEAAKRTGAAPSYFRLDGGSLLDGGLVSNNPTMDAMTELIQLSAAVRSMDNSCDNTRPIPSVVVSLGTGIQPQEDVDTNHFDISMPAGIFDVLTKVPKVKALINLLIDQATQTEGQVVERARAWCSSLGTPFFRFSPPLTQFVELDETDDATLVNLMWETRAYMFTQRHKIIELKHTLLQCASPVPIDCDD